MQNYLVKDKIMKNENKRDVILEFIFSKYITGADIESACQSLIQKTHSEERKKVLQNCIDLFSDPYAQQKIEEIQKAEQPKNNSEFIQLLLATFAEDIFDYEKRQYDMSGNYKGNKIKTITQPNGVAHKDISFHNISKDTPPFILHLEDNDVIMFEHIGTLKLTPISSNINKTVDQFRIKFMASNGNQQVYTVFTNIDFKKLSNKSYLRAVLEELLSRKNIEQSNCNGYIGELVSSNNFIDTLKIGEQSNYSEFYLGSGTRYKFSNNYELVYDFDTLEAVVDYTREQEKLRKKEKFNPSNWFMDL